MSRAILVLDFSKLQIQQYTYQKTFMTNSSHQLRNMVFNQTFQSSLVQKNNQKFMLDKSLYKGIKENDVTKIIDQNALNGTNQKKQVYNQFQEIQAIVIDTRKRYDQVKAETTKCQQDIEKLKKQKEALAVQEFQYSDAIEKTKRSFEEVNKRLEEVTNLMETTVFRKDMLANIKDNSKHDVLVLKKRYFDKDVRLMRDNTKLRTIRTEHDSKVKLSQRCRQVLQSVEKKVQQKQGERTSKIQSYYEILSKKQATQQSRQARDKQIKEAMLSAMTDKLSQEKQWIRMFNSNLFLKGVLRSKMERLMNRYNKVQLSFHKMKQATSLRDSNQFIERFLTREQTYGLLLQSISEKQKLLQNLKQEKNQLQKMHMNYMYRGEQIGEEKKKIQPGKNKNVEDINLQQNLQKMNEQLLLITSEKQLIYQWGIKFLTGFSQNGKKDQISSKFPKTKTKELFLQVLKTINQFLTDLEKEKDHKQKIQEAFMKNNPKDNRMTQQILQKNTRVKTFSTYQNEGRLDSFEDKDMIYDDISEKDYIQHNRRAVKKNDMQNRKFRIKTKPF